MREKPGRKGRIRDCRRPAGLCSCDVSASTVSDIWTRRENGEAVPMAKSCPKCWTGLGCKATASNHRRGRRRVLCECVPPSGPGRTPSGFGSHCSFVEPAAAPTRRQFPCVFVRQGKTLAHTRTPNQTTNMKPSLLQFTCAAGLICAAALAADDAAALAGKWSAKKVNDEGQKYTQ